MQVGNPHTNHQTLSLDQAEAAKPLAIQTFASAEDSYNEAKLAYDRASETLADATKAYEQQYGEKPF